MKSNEELEQEISDLYDIILYLTEWMSRAFNYYRDPIANPISESLPPNLSLYEMKPRSISTTNPRILEILTCIENLTKEAR